MLIYVYEVLAVSTRPPAGRNYRAARSNSLSAYAPLSGVSLAFTRCQLLLHYTAAAGATANVSSLFARWR